VIYFAQGLLIVSCLNRVGANGTTGKSRNSA